MEPLYLSYIALTISVCFGWVLDVIFSNNFCSVGMINEYNVKMERMLSTSLIYFYYPLKQTHSEILH